LAILVKLAWTIAIIGILAALWLPVFSKGKQRAQGVVGLNEGKQLMRVEPREGD